MIDDFAKPAWAEAHDKFAADLTAGIAHVARWLRSRAKAKDLIPAVTLGGERSNDSAIYRDARQGAEAERIRLIHCKTEVEQITSATTITKLRANAKT